MAPDFLVIRDPNEINPRNAETIGSPVPSDAIILQLKSVGIHRFAGKAQATAGKADEAQWARIIGAGRRVGYRPA